VRLEAGKQPLDAANRPRNRLFPHPSAEKPAAPRSAFAAARPISYLRRASLGAGIEQVGYIVLFGIAVETGVVMVVYLHESLERRMLQGKIHTNADLEEAVIEGAVKRLRPKLMTVIAVLASLAPILWESGIGSDVMKPIAAPIVGGMNTSTIHVLILVPVFFVMMKERALRKGTLHPGPETVEAPLSKPQPQLL
jgi:multidrug efflux pump subunit AcrB